MARRLGPSDPFRLVIDRTELNKLLFSEHSDIALDLAFRAQRTAARQRRLAPKRTGYTKSKIGWAVGVDEKGVYADAGVMDDAQFYPAIVDKGHKTEAGTFVSPRRYVRPGLKAARRGRPR